MKRLVQIAAAGVLSLCAAAASGQISPVPAPAAPPPPAPPGSAPAAPPSAALPGNAPKIVGLRMIGSTAVSPDTVLYYLGVHVGDPYDPAKIRKNFVNLWSSALFDDIRVDADRGPEGVTLFVTVTERPTITSVEYTGNKKLSVSQFRDKLTQEKASIKTGAPLSMKDVAAVSQAIRDAYQENGFRSVSVDWRVEGKTKTDQKLVFVIDEGEKIKISAIRFTGNHVFSAARIRLAMKKTKVNTVWRLLSDKTVYNQANFDEDIESIKHLYQDYGYKDVVVKEPQLEIYAKNPAQKNPKKIHKRVRITIPLVEGDKFYFGKIDVGLEEGDPKVFPKEELLREFRYCRPGAVLSRARMTEALSVIESKYKKKGYIYWYGEPQYQAVSKDRRVDIVVRMFEGDPFRLGRLEFTGNTGTRDKVLRRQVAIDEGQVLDMDAFKKSIVKISQLGYFKLGEDPSFVPDNAKKTVDVTVKGEETSRNELNFGAGYSGFDGFFGQFSFSTRNFLGRGEIISASVQLGRITKLYDVGYTVPWFRDKDQTVGGQIYSRQSTYLDIDDRRKGFSVFWGRALGIFDSYSLTYGLESIHSRYPVQPAPVPPGAPVPPLATSLVDGTTSYVSPGYRYDSTDDPIDPSTGRRFFVAVEYAGLGGSNYFVKPSLGGTAYIPFLHNRYFGVHAEAAYAIPIAGRDLPIFERFSLGGEQNIRGFPIGSIVPVDRAHHIFVDPQGRILGGDKYAVLNVEYVFARLGPVKLLSFFDAGNTWIEHQSFVISDIRSSVGLEMRLVLPIFQAPLRFIYSWNLHPIQPLDQFGFPISRLKEKRSGFDFSIGTTF
ncbi:MAG TPA: outer membrane protein assembly factor BamA [Thermoanaerobaculia bacterium]|nr:outer membrane protein assembly factor BamA [Thermoanaerobaculia bacterium]